MKTHSVARGETSAMIARRYGVTQSDLFAANPHLRLAANKYGEWDFAPSQFVSGVRLTIPETVQTPSVARPNVGMVAPWVTATWNTPFSAHATYAEHYAGVLRRQLAKWGMATTNVTQELADLAFFLRVAFGTPQLMFEWARGHLPPAGAAEYAIGEAPPLAGGITSHVLGYSLGALYYNTTVPTVPMRPDRLLYTQQGAPVYCALQQRTLDNGSLRFELVCKSAVP